jgi:hypothetical protein
LLTVVTAASTAVSTAFATATAITLIISSLIRVMTSPSAFLATPLTAFWKAGLLRKPASQ